MAAEPPEGEIMKRKSIVPEIQRRVLAHLADGPSTPSAMIAAGAGSQSSVSTALLALEGYGEAIVVPPMEGLRPIDHRRRWYMLTDAGRERLAELEAER